MQRLGKLLVRVSLYTQGLIYRKYFEEERKLISIFLADFSGHQSLIVLHQIEERPLSGYIFGRLLWVRPHPQLCIWLSLINGEIVRRSRRGVSSRGRMSPRFACMAELAPAKVTLRTMFTPIITVDSYNIVSEGA